MNSINWLDRPLPKKTVMQGINMPVYLDEPSINKLDGNINLCNQANWLIHIHKAPKTIASTEKKLVNTFIQHLDKALKSFEKLAPNNQARIDNYGNPQILKALAERAADCAAEPLPKKLDLENLYRTFVFNWPPLKAKGLKRDTFDNFMLVVNKHISAEPISLFDYDDDKARIIDKYKSVKKMVDSERK